MKVTAATRIGTRFMKNLWRNLVKTLRGSKDIPEEANMPEKFWRNIVDTSLKTEENEIDCAACFEMLDEYIDLLDDGEDPATILPQIEQHLAVCHCCNDELNAILTALRSAADPESEAP